MIVGILMSAGLSVGAYLVTKPSYEITSTVLLLPPESSYSTGIVNPYLRLGGLAQAVDLVGVVLSDQQTHLELKDVSKDVQYTVQLDARTSSPLLLIDVTDSSPDTARKIRDILVAEVPVRLDSMQASLGVQAKDRVTSTVVTSDVEAQEVGKNRLRSAVVAGGAGVALTLVIAALWDVHRLRHPRRRRSRRMSASTNASRAVDPEQLPDEPLSDDEGTLSELESTLTNPVSPADGLGPDEEFEDVPHDVAR